MSYFAGNQHYTLRWPPDLFAQEIQRLILRGTEFGMAREWVGEVEVLLGQAFESQIPAEDFIGSVKNPPPTRTYGWDEEPF